MSQLRGAVIGVGYLGNFHAQKVAANSRSQLVGVFDPHQAQADKIAQSLNCKSFKTLEEIPSQVDFVTIAAATQAHYDLAEFFLKKNIPTLVEKPIAATAEQGQKLTDLAAKNNVIFSVGHIERFNPAYKYLKENNKNIRFLEINRLAPFRVRGSDVSVLHDLMIHDYDLVQFIFNQKIKKHMIFGHQMIRPTTDDVSVYMELESGTQVHIQNSRLMPQIVRNYRAILNDHTLFMNTATMEGEFLYPAMDQESLMRTEKLTLEKVDALALEIDHFISAVKKEKPVAITPQEATDALLQIESFVKELGK